LRTLYAFSILVQASSVSTIPAGSSTPALLDSYSTRHSPSHLWNLWIAPS